MKRLLFVFSCCSKFIAKWQYAANQWKSCLCSAVDPNLHIGSQQHAANQFKNCCSCSAVGANLQPIALLSIHVKLLFVFSCWCKSIANSIAINPCKTAVCVQLLVQIYSQQHCCQSTEKANSNYVQLLHPIQWEKG